MNWQEKNNLYVCFYNFPFLGQTFEEDWDCWCISKATHGDAFNWYTLFSIEEDEEDISYKG